MQSGKNGTPFEFSSLLLRAMPSERQPRAGRQEAVRIFTRVGNVRRTPEGLKRDAPKEAVEWFLEQVIPAVESPAEMDELHRGIALWNSGGGQALYLPENVPEDVQNAPQAEAAMPRVHCTALSPSLHLFHPSLSDVYPPCRGGGAQCPATLRS